MNATRAGSRPRGSKRALDGRPAARVLDLGCGSGEPIAAYLVARGCELTGVDGARGMVEIFQRKLPGARAVVGDMRTLDLGETFDLVLAWNSFFHLELEAQWQAFDVFARHCKPGGDLLFTSGSRASEVWGVAGGAPVFHASASIDSYRTELASRGFEVRDVQVEDAECRGHTVWLARKRG